MKHLLTILLLAITSSAIAGLPLVEATFSPATEAILVPVNKGERIHVYQPQPDAFPGPDSPRFKTGSEPMTIYSLPDGKGGGPESPSILKLHGGFYLIWCRWDPELSKKFQSNPR